MSSFEPHFPSRPRPLRMSSLPPSRHPIAALPLRRHSSYVAVPQPDVYVALYSTLQAKWGRRADDLAATGEFSRIVTKKRSREDDIPEDSVKATKAPPTPSPSNSPSPASDEPTEQRTALKRARRNSSVPLELAASIPASLLDTAMERSRSLNTIVPLFQPTPSRFGASASLLSHDDPFLSPRAFVRSSSISSSSGGERTDRAEALLRVVRSFEIVLGCRADAWRALADK